MGDYTEYLIKSIEKNVTLIKTHYSSINTLQRKLKQLESELICGKR